MVDGGLSADLSEVPSDVLAAFAALSNPHRLHIYQRLLAQQQTAAFSRCLLQDIIAHLNIGAPTLSHHIKILEQAQLIEVERRGKYLHCAINHHTQQRLAQFFAR